jgi:hypothetical protein
MISRARLIRLCSPCVVSFFIFTSPVYMVYKEVASDDTSTKLFGALLNALVFVVVIVIVTVIFVILYKYRCLKVHTCLERLPPSLLSSHVVARMASCCCCCCWLKHARLGSSSSLGSSDRRA